MGIAVKEKKPHRPKLLKRAKEFDDTEREYFVKIRVKKYPSKKKWIKFKWVELMQFFGIASAFRITRALGGKEFYVTKAYYEPRGSDDKEYKKGNPRWRKWSREELKRLIGIDDEKLLYKHFKGTYIGIPAKRLFWTSEYISFGQVGEKTVRRIEIIDKKLKEGLHKKDIAASLGISPQDLWYYTRTYQLEPLR